MPRSTIIYDIFLSSPSDVSEERKFIVELSQQWNSLHSKARSCYLNVLTWEDLVAPALSDRPQSAINEQIGDQYDAYLGIMWSRFGSATGKSESGTVEEFERALERYRRGEGIHVAMLFKIKDIPTSVLDGEQFSKVQAFRKRYSDEGGMYRTFQDTDDLRLLVNRWFESIVASPDEQGHSSETSSDSPMAASNIDVSDIGLIELNYELSELSSLQAIFLEGWTNHMIANSAHMDSAMDLLSDLSKFGNADPKSLNDVMVGLSTNLDRLSLYLEDGIKDFISRDDDIVQLVNAGFDIIQGFDNSAQEAEWISSVEDLLSSVSSNLGQISSLLETMKSTPRLSRIYNIAKNRFTKAQTALMDEMTRLERMLKQSLERAKDSGW